MFGIFFFFVAINSLFLRILTGGLCYFLSSLGRNYSDSIYEFIELSNESNTSRYRGRSIITGGKVIISDIPTSEFICIIIDTNPY